MISLSILVLFTVVITFAFYSNDETSFCLSGSSGGVKLSIIDRLPIPMCQPIRNLRIVCFLTMLILAIIPQKAGISSVVSVMQ